MNSQKLIANEISPVSTEDRGTTVLSLMSEFRVSQLPVVENNKLLGLVSEDDIYNMNDENNKIETILNTLSAHSMTTENDVFEIIQKLDKNNITLLPLISEDKYIGCVTEASIVKALASIIAVKEGGSLIILEMKKEDYQMSEISQIIESNNAKILSSYISNTSNSEKISVSLKLNIDNLNAIKQTFERYNYLVSAHYQPTDTSNDSTLSDRYEGLMRYLNP
jgi:acetoin utilization protein AcuB